MDTAAVDVQDDVEHNADDAWRPNIRCIVIDCSSMTYIDYVGMTTIQQVSAVGHSRCNCILHLGGM